MIEIEKGYKTVLLRIAEAFAESIGSVAEVIQQILLSGTATADQLRLTGEAVHPGRIPEGSDELAQLRHFLLGGWEDKHAAMRRSTAWLLLDAYRRGVAAGNTDQLRNLWYDRRLPDGKGYEQAGETIDRWRAYQANEYCHVAMECLLNGFVGAQADDYPDGIEPSQLLDAVAAEALPAASASWADWALAVAENPDATEQTLSASIIKAVQSARRPEAVALTDSLRLLARLWLRWSSEAGGVRKIISLIAGPNGRSLDGVLRSLDANADLSARDAVIALMRRHILIDHQTIAGQKLADANTYTYHFLVADGLLTDGELGEYAYTNPRLANFTRLLRDAKLIGAAGVSTDGEAFLADHQPL